MKRQINLDQMTDGKSYSCNDMAKIGCNDCKGCHACCTHMGKSIILDPYDMNELCFVTKKSPTQLLESMVELSVVEGMILPNIKLAGEKEQCPFLNEQYRCSIHEHRPGMCRLFPLARLYENNDFSYIIQIKECAKELQAKVKIKKWLGIPKYNEYHQYINRWHYFIQNLQNHSVSLSEEQLKQWNLLVLQSFYLTPYDESLDFYSQFYERLDKIT